MLDVKQIMLLREFIYVLSSDMNLRTGKIKNYNDITLVSSSSLNLGTNLETNLDYGKHKEKDRPDIKSKNEDKQDINLPVRRGVGMTPQRFFSHNSAQNEPKLAKFLLIQVR